MVEAAALRDQLEQAATLREENERLAQQLRTATERSEADLRELVRLRGQAGNKHRASERLIEVPIGSPARVHRLPQGKGLFIFAPKEAKPGEQGTRVVRRRAVRRVVRFLESRNSRGHILQM